MEADTLEGFYQQMSTYPDMLAQYRIKVHSMKSSANLIGAIVLGGMAKLLEDGARDANIKLIEALHDTFLKEWRGYKEKLKECVNLADDAQADQAKDNVEDYQEIVGYLKQLQTAMGEMDIDRMDEMMEKLEGFQYSDPIQKNIERLSVLVTNIDSEQAAICIEELINQIK